MNAFFLCNELIRSAKIMLFYRKYKISNFF